MVFCVMCACQRGAAVFSLKRQEGMGGAIEAGAHKLLGLGPEDNFQRVTGEGKKRPPCGAMLIQLSWTPAT